ncbi:MAG TPA: alpha/beta hydrolase [Acidimicrobiia bacterium]|nr:alpha/beta hydrolase [Acidimicrobiia bacterium]
MSSAFLFVYGLVALFLTSNAIRKPSPPSSRFPALWLPAVFVAEIPWFWFLLRIVVSGGFAAIGAHQLPIGRVGLLVLAIAQVLQLELVRRADASAREVGPGRAAAAWWERITGWPYRIPAGIERTAGIEYRPGLTLDVYRPSGPPTESVPCLVYVHGGSWGGGDPRRVFRTVVHHLASQGWGVLTIRYPLSPTATFPDHVVGVNRALHWVKTKGAETFGLDPDRIAVAGGSAGAHLASLAVLSNGDHQPGFESADTSVKAAVVLYGIYDFFNRNNTRVNWSLIPNRVMKAALADAPDRYREASPLDQVRGDAPPFLVVHGTSDSLVPIAEAEFFVEALRAVGAPVEFLPVRRAQHAFDVLGGVRTRALAVRIEHFLESSFSETVNDSLPSDAHKPDAA